MVDIEIRRGTDRSVSHVPGIVTRHSFAFGNHFDPDNTGFGALLAHNEEILEPAAGYDDHVHRDVEIVTWPLTGVLAHEDSTGHVTRVEPGEVQYTSAGAGVTHAERNGSRTEPAGFVQMWLEPDEFDTEPEYDHQRLPVTFQTGGWLTIAAGRHDGSGTALVKLRRRNITLRARRWNPGESAPLAWTSPYTHLYVTTGSVTIAGIGALKKGDAARVTVANGEITESAPICAGEHGAELLVWEMGTVPADGRTAV